ncbi:TPR repeat protein [mine drainage metagenome]|uniref:TPR repeat protein n=1 Tax=mine drainage metagenome TaxID=410659 RepID=T1C9J2_9ZZZZ
MTTKWIFVRDFHIMITVSARTALIAVSDRFRPGPYRMQESLSVKNPALTDARAEQLYLEGNDLRRQGDTEGAEAVLKEALQLAPDHLPALSSLAFLYRAEGRLRDAEDLLAAWTRETPRDPHALIQIAGFLEEIRAYPMALACLDEAVQKAPAPGRPWFLRGRLLLQLGRTGQAIESFETALEREGTLDAAFLELAHARTFEPGDPLIGFFERARQIPGLMESTEAGLCFALGKICDDQGLWDPALEWIETANRLRRKRIRYDRPNCETMLRERLLAPRKLWDPLPERAPAQSPDPLFILGLPRSGTAVLERLLTEHPAIVSAGELPALPALVRSTHLVERWRAFEASREPVPDEEMATLREAYLGALHETAGNPPGTVRYIIDRNPFNFFEVGIIRRLFPRAPVFALERDSRDILISLYFHDFDHPDLAFTYSIEEIDFFIQAHQRIMAFWSALPVPRMRTVRYETLMAEPPIVVQSLLRFLDLDPDHPPSPHDLAPRLIAAASAWLARQPAYGRTSGHWKHYAEGLLARHPELGRMGWVP